MGDNRLRSWTRLEVTLVKTVLEKHVARSATHRKVLPVGRATPTSNPNPGSWVLPAACPPCHPEGHWAQVKCLEVTERCKVSAKVP